MYERNRVMKTLRYLLIVIAAMAVLSVSAQSLAQQPQAEFHSTSSMVTSGSTLPQAAQSGAYTTYDYGYNPSRANKPGLRREDLDGDGFEDEEFGEHGDDPYADPIGDALLPLLLMAFAFGTFVALKRKRKTVKK